MTDEPAAWRPDPTGRHEHRYWDGASWTDHVADAGVASTDAYVGDADETPADEAPGAPGWDDPTAVQANPGADVTTSWSAVPPPPGAPVPPVATGGPVPDGDDGARRRLLVGGGILAVVVLAVLAFLALRDDGDDEVSPVGDRSAEDGDGGEAGGTSLPGGEVDVGDLDELEGMPVDDAMVAQIADIYEQSFGLERAKAECLATSLAEAIESGELSEAQVTSDVMDFLDACGISLSELSGAGG